MSDLAGLYNADGVRVGAWCDATGRVQIGSAFYAMESTCSVKQSVHDIDGSRHYLTCGHRADTWLDDPPSFCPICGAKVVGE